MTVNRWLKTKDSDFALQCRRWITLLRAEGAIEVYMWLAVLHEEVCAKIDAFLAAYAVYLGVDNSANRTAKNVTKRAAMTAMQNFANSSIRFNPFMTEAARQEFGIAPRNAATPQPSPESAPTVVVETTLVRYQHRVKALNPDTGKTAKPAGVHGIRVVWKVGGDRPSGCDAMEQGLCSRKTVVAISHREIHFGKMVWFAARYENAKGEFGPWSEMVETYVM